MAWIWCGSNGVGVLFGTAPAMFITEGMGSLARAARFLFCNAGCTSIKLQGVARSAPNAYGLFVG